MVREAGASADVGVLLLDLVLGRAVAPGSRGAAGFAAIYDARGPPPLTAARSSWSPRSSGPTGTRRRFARQVATLEAAGVEVLPSNAQAARFAALLARPDLERSLLSDRDG